MWFLKRRELSISTPRNLAFDTGLTTSLKSKTQRFSSVLRERERERERGRERERESKDEAEGEMERCDDDDDDKEKS